MRSKNMASPYDQKYDSLRSQIIAMAKKYGIKPEIAIWQIWQESRYKVNAESPVGAFGLTQFMPPTAKQYGVKRNDVNSQLEGYGKYMSYLLKMFGGDYAKALAGYNAGEGNVKKYKGVPPFKETQKYVKLILANAQPENETIKKTEIIAGGISGAVVLIAAIGFFF